MEYTCNAAVTTIQLRKTIQIEGNCFPQQGQPVSGQAVSKRQLFINGARAAGAGSGQARVTAQLKVRIGTGVRDGNALRDGNAFNWTTLNQTTEYDAALKTWPVIIGTGQNATCCGMTKSNNTSMKSCLSHCSASLYIILVSLRACNSFFLFSWLHNDDDKGYTGICRHAWLWNWWLWWTLTLTFTIQWEQLTLAFSICFSPSSLKRSLMGMSFCCSSGLHKSNTSSCMGNLTSCLHQITFFTCIVTHKSNIQHHYK